MMAEKLVEIKNLEVWLGGVKVVKDFNMECREGDIVQIKGANGSGKSTVLKSLMGLISEYQGEILLHPKLLKGEATIPLDCFYIGHKLSIQESLSCQDNLTYLACLQGLKVTKAEIDQTLAIVKLSTHLTQKTSSLSAGQKKRLALARLKLVWRELWVLDEPLASLDAQSQKLIATLIKQHQSEGGAVILTSHQDLEVQTRSYSMQ